LKCTTGAIRNNFTIEIALENVTYMWRKYYNTNPWFYNYLSMKVVCLLCFVLMRSTKLGCFRLRSWSVWKALEEEGCIGLISCHFNLLCSCSWTLNDFFTEKIY
jgi:hypothetical protein